MAAARRDVPQRFRAVPSVAPVDEPRSFRFDLRRLLMRGARWPGSLGVRSSVGARDAAQALSEAVASALSAAVPRRAAARSAARRDRGWALRPSGPPARRARRRSAARREVRPALPSLRSFRPALPWERGSGILQLEARARSPRLLAPPVPRRRLRPPRPPSEAAGLTALTRRGGGSKGATGLTGSAAFLGGTGFLPLTTGVSANMSPPGREMLRWRARRSTNCRATTSSMVLEALFTSIP